MTTTRPRHQTFALAAEAPPCPSCQERAEQTHAAVTPSGGWAGVIGEEGVLTGDGRLIQPGALRWESLPIVLRYVPQDIGEHNGAEVVGHILTVGRNEQNQIVATGDFDLDGEAGREAARHVGQDLTNGVSMDLDDMSFEMRVAGEVLDDMDAAPEGAEQPDGQHAAESTDRETDADGRVTVGKIASDDEVIVITDARIRAATIVAIPAFSHAKIHATDAAPEVAAATPALTLSQRATVTAGAAPLDAGRPPVNWFESPQLSGVTGLTVTDDGHVYGHLAAWGTCHIAHTQECVQPPNSVADYAYFRVGSVRTADGTDVAVGHITMDTTHAQETATAAATLSHYEDTGTVVADIAAGEDAYGIWISGAVRPGSTPEQIHALRSAPLSGDWRRIGGNLELVAALAVNVPGFPIPRPAGLVAGGQTVSLVASGMVPHNAARDGEPRLELSLNDQKYLRAAITREKKANRDRVDSMARQFQARSLASRVRATTSH